jgi:hypothetical protein
VLVSVADDSAEVAAGAAADSPAGAVAAGSDSDLVVSCAGAVFTFATLTSAARSTAAIQG